MGDIPDPLSGEPGYQRPTDLLNAEYRPRPGEQQNLGTTNLENIGPGKYRIWEISDLGNNEPEEHRT